jgi:hypothetical protein
MEMHIMADKINYTRSRLRGAESQLEAAKEHGVKSSYAQFNCKGKWSAAKSLCKSYGCRAAQSIGTDFILYQNILKYQADTDKIRAQAEKFKAAKKEKESKIIKETPVIKKEAKKEIKKLKKEEPKHKKESKKISEKLSKKLSKK